MNDSSQSSPTDDSEHPLAIVVNDVDDSPPICKASLNNYKQTNEQKFSEMSLVKRCSVEENSEPTTQTSTLESDDINSDTTSFIDVVNNSDDTITIKTPHASPVKPLVPPNLEEVSVLNPLETNKHKPSDSDSAEYDNDISKISTLPVVNALKETSLKDDAPLKEIPTFSSTAIAPKKEDNQNVETIDLDEMETKNDGDEGNRKAASKSTTSEALSFQDVVTSNSVMTTVTATSNSTTTTTSSTIQQPLTTPIVHPQFMNVPNIINSSSGIIYQTGVHGGAYITTNNTARGAIPGTSIFHHNQARALTASFIHSPGHNAANQKIICGQPLNVNSPFANPTLVTQSTLGPTYPNPQAGILTSSGFITQQNPPGTQQTLFQPSIVPFPTYNRPSGPAFIAQPAFSPANTQFHNPANPQQTSNLQISNQSMNLPQPTNIQTSQSANINQTSGFLIANQPSSISQISNPLLTVESPEIDADCNMELPSDVKQIASRRWRPTMKQKTSIKTEEVDIVKQTGTVLSHSVIQHEDGMLRRTEIVLPVNNIDQKSLSKTVTSPEVIPKSEVVGRCSDANKKEDTRVPIPMDFEESIESNLSSKKMLSQSQLALPTQAMLTSQRQRSRRTTSSSSTAESAETSSMDSSQDSLPLGSSAVSKNEFTRDRRPSSGPRRPHTRISLSRRASQMTEPSRIVRQPSIQLENTASTRSSFSHIQDQPLMDQDINIELDANENLSDSNEQREKQRIARTSQIKAQKEEKEMFSLDRKILTHFIDGHTIYESNKMFPAQNGMEIVESVLLQMCMNDKDPHYTNGINSPQKKNYRPAAIKTDFDEEEIHAPTQALPTLPMRNVAELLQQRDQQTRQRNKSGSSNKRRHKSDSSSHDETSFGDVSIDPHNVSREGITEAYIGVKTIDQWTVGDVCDFIQTINGCGQYTETFKTHEIDGEALLLLSEQQFVQSIGMKIGPALKLVSKLKDVKRDTGMT